MTYIVGYMFVRNEEDFLEFSLPNAANKVDKLILIDTGSTDKSLDIIKKSGLENVQLLTTEQKEKRYKWDEGKMRNYAMSICEKENPDYIFYQDPDELLDCNLHEIVKSREPYYTFGFIDIVYRKYVRPFGIHLHVRLFVPNIFRHTRRNHSVLSLNGSVLSTRKNIVADAIVFHMHRYNNLPKKDEDRPQKQAISQDALDDIPRNIEITKTLRQFWNSKGI